jgi:hypothetical protein
MTQTILCTSVQWTCGHYTTTVGEMPRYCPICTGQSDVKFLEVHMNLPPALDKPV